MEVYTAATNQATNQATTSYNRSYIDCRKNRRNFCREIVSEAC